MKNKNQISQAVSQIKAAILQSQGYALRSTNQCQLALYYAIGKYVSRNSRKGYWGEGVLAAISQQLRKDLPGLRGFSVRNLQNMRTFAESWLVLENTVHNHIEIGLNSADASAEFTAQSQMPVQIDKDGETEINPFELVKSFSDQNWQTPSAEFSANDFFSLSFSHHILILAKAKYIEERSFYIHQAAANQWSCRELDKQMLQDVFHHQGRMPNNFIETLPEPRQALRAIRMLKDSYLLDYINTEELGVRDEEDIDERIIEQGIVQNIKRFILTFGQDFAFMGNQYRIEAMGHVHFIDLLFYNRELNCMVAVELKAGAFKTSYLGQLNGYLNILDDYVKKPHENPSIGIVLCKDVDKTYVEYMVRSYQKPMGVATYMLSSDMPEKLRKALPDIEELKKML